MHRLKQRFRQLVQKTSRPLKPWCLLRHQRTRIIQQEYVMTASSNAVRPIDDQPNLNGVPPDFPTCVIDSFEARRRLLTESERISQQSERDWQVQGPAIGRGRSVGVANSLEEGIHWLISAAVLACSVLGILGL
jgi:hypothetical protein